jgi:hypothetical protein
MNGTAAFTAEEAREFRAAHDAEARRLSRMTVAQLRREDDAELARRGWQRIRGGPASKDELICEILGYRYPAGRLNETTHILYHKAGRNVERVRVVPPAPGQHLRMFAPDQFLR